jgi:hypothetical protein
MNGYKNIDMLVVLTGDLYQRGGQTVYSMEPASEKHRDQVGNVSFVVLHNIICIKFAPDFEDTFWRLVGCYSGSEEFWYLHVCSRIIDLHMHG